MTVHQNSQKPLFLELSFEDCYEEVERLADSCVSETSGVKVVTGQHPNYGGVHIIIPPMGNGMMMFQAKPVLIQVFE